MAGSPPQFPSLVGVADRVSRAEITDVIRHGKGRMPGFPNLEEDQLSALVQYLTTGENKELPASEPAPPQMKYRFTGYHKFLDAEGYLRLFLRGAH